MATAASQGLAEALERVEHLLARFTEKRLFTYDEAAHYTGISKRSIMAEAESRLPVRRYGNKPLIERKDLDALIDRWPYE